MNKDIDTNFSLAEYLKITINWLYVFIPGVDTVALLKH